jgi:hypothetical protein
MSAPTETRSAYDVLGAAVDRDRAWHSTDLDDGAITSLSVTEIGDLAYAAKALPADCFDWADFSLDAITTAPLSARFDELAEEVAHGRGFVILRGLDANDPEMLRRMFWILGNHFGTPVMQNARGEILSEVYDRFAGAPRSIDSRGYESNDELRFHCDGGDCIGLGCVRPSPTGGGSGLVSLFAIYNELLAHHPEHLATLYRGFPLYVRKEAVGDGSSTREASVADRCMPTFAVKKGRLSAWLNMVLAEHAASALGKPMDATSRAALACVEEIAERPNMKLRFTLEAGDVMWVHNMAVMHRRDFYQDDPDPGKRRFFYRMWTNFRTPRDVVPEHAALRVGIRGPVPVVVGPGAAGE